MKDRPLPGIRRHAPVFVPSVSLPLVSRGRERLSLMTMASQPLSPGFPEPLWTFAPYGRSSRQLDLRPQTAAPLFENIPAELIDSPHWVCWDWWWYQRVKEYHSDPDRPGRHQAEWQRYLVKGPISPLDGETVMWGQGVTTFENAHNFYHEQHVAGIAYCFSDDEPFLGIQLAHCRDPRSGVLDPHVRRLVEHYGSYTEASIEATGIHILLRKHELGWDIEPAASSHASGEGRPQVLRDDSFLAITGQHELGTPGHIVTISARDLSLLDWLAPSAPHAIVGQKNDSPRPDPPALPPFRRIIGAFDLGLQASFIHDLRATPSKILVQSDVGLWSLERNSGSVLHREDRPGVHVPDSGSAPPEITFRLRDMRLLADGMGISYEQGKLKLVNEGTGTTVWDKQLIVRKNSGEFTDSPMYYILSGDTIYVHFYHKSESSSWLDITAIDSLTGDFRWSYEKLDGVLFVNDRAMVVLSFFQPAAINVEEFPIAFVNDEGHDVDDWEPNWGRTDMATQISVIDAASGDILWGGTCEKFIAGNDSTLLFKEGEDVKCVDLTTGVSVWTHSVATSDDREIEGALIGDWLKHASVYSYANCWHCHPEFRCTETLLAIALGRNGSVFLLDRSTGLVLWNNKFGAPLIGLELSTDQLIVATDHRVYAYPVPSGTG